MNPTGVCFNYNWKPLHANTFEISLFHCHKPEGYVEKGRSTEAVFSFLPQSAGTFEAFYIFNIEKYKSSKTFLFVAKAREPNIAFALPHLEIRPTVIGVDVHEQIALINNEDVETDFKFRRDSFYSDARHQALDVEPLKGVLAPFGQKQIK